MNLIHLVFWFGMAMAAHKGAGCVAGDECQCLFADGSHCCTYGSVSTIALSRLSMVQQVPLVLTIGFTNQSANSGNAPQNDCTAVCKGASRLLLSGEDTPKKCNAGGAFSCVGLITAQGRIPCYA
jgi:hypothetical protein